MRAESSGDDYDTHIVGRQHADDDIESSPSAVFSLDMGDSIGHPLLFQELGAGVFSQSRDLIVFYANKRWHGNPFNVRPKEGVPAAGSWQRYQLSLYSSLKHSQKPNIAHDFTAPMRY